LTILITASAVTSAQAVDFISEIDNAVVSIHDYSVLSGTINAKMSSSQMKTTVSKMNEKLKAIRIAIVKYDKDLTYNWKVLIENDNVNYPHRQLLKDFDTQVFDWFNYEQGLQKKVATCFKQKTDSVSCVLKFRKAAKNDELSRYSALTDTLDSIQSWRTRFNR
jgi:hypothetical protein